MSVRTEFLALVTNEDADRTFTELLFIVNINDELHFKKTGGKLLLKAKCLSSRYENWDLFAILLPWFRQSFLRKKRSFQWQTVPSLEVLKWATETFVLNR